MRTLWFWLHPSLSDTGATSEELTHVIGMRIVTVTLGPVVDAFREFSGSVVFTRRLLVGGAFLFRHRGLSNSKSLALIILAGFNQNAARWHTRECDPSTAISMRIGAQARDPAGCKNLSENMRPASPTRSNRTDRRRQSYGKHPRYNRLYRAQSSTKSDCHPPQIHQSNPPVRYRCYSTRSSCRRCAVRSLGTRYRQDANR